MYIDIGLNLTNRQFANDQEELLLRAESSRCHSNDPNGYFSQK